MSSRSQALPCFSPPASVCLWCFLTAAATPSFLPTWFQWQCCLTSSFLWTTQVGCIQVAGSHTAPLRVRGLREACSAVHSVLCQGRWPHGSLWGGLVLISSSPSSRVQPCGDTDPLSLGGPGLCPLPPAPQGTVNTEAGIHLVENVKLMRTSFVYTSGFPLSLSSLAS